MTVVSSVVVESIMAGIFLNLLITRDTFVVIAIFDTIVIVMLVWPVRTAIVAFSLSFANYFHPVDRGFNCRCGQMIR